VCIDLDLSKLSVKIFPNLWTYLQITMPSASYKKIIRYVHALAYEMPNIS
jgi:hypothetical protein